MPDPVLNAVLVVDGRVAQPGSEQNKAVAVTLNCNQVMTNFKDQPKSVLLLFPFYWMINKLICVP